MDDREVMRASRDEPKMEVPDVERGSEGWGPAVMVV
jgi:hypothetical protein